MPKGQGFKKTGGGPKYGSFSFPSGAGFTHSGSNKQNVKGYSRSVPKRKFAHGGMVTTPMASGDSSVIKRTKPVTGFDAEHGGKGPLRPGFNKGGKACYAEGGKVATTGAAIKLMKELMKRGNSAEDAAAKAARRYGVSKSDVKPAGPAVGGGGMPADKQMLARGGLGKAVQRALPAAMAKQPVTRNAGPIKAPVGRAAPPATAVSTAPQMSNHGYGSFRGRPLFGRG